MADYPEFRACVIKRLAMIVARLNQAGPLLPINIVAQAFLCLDYALEVAEAWPHTRELLLAMAPKMEQAGYRDEWMPYLARGIQLGQQVGDPASVAELQLHLGMLYQLRSKYSEAWGYLEASATGFERLEQTQKRALVLNRLAYVARLQRRFDEATHLVQTVQGLLKAEGAERAFAYYVLGLIALDKRQWPEAVDCSERAYILGERTNQRRLMGRSLLCRGVALEKMGRYPEALDICQQAMTLFEQTEDRFYRAIAQMNLGNVYFALEQPSAALELYLHTERIFRQVQDQLYLAYVNNNIGICWRRLQQWDKAREAYLSSIRLCQQIGNLERLANSMDGLGLTYLEEKRFEEAENIFKEALTQLTQIKDAPGYAHWLEILTAHLQEASKKGDLEE